MTPITLKKQTITDGCVAACVAMLLNKPVTEVMDDFHHRFVNHEIDLIDYLLENGITAVPPNWQDRYRILGGFIYVLSVPSCNTLARMHMVLLDVRDQENPKLYDPSNDRVYCVPGEASGPGEVDLTSWTVEAVVHLEERYGSCGQ